MAHVVLLGVSCDLHDPPRPEDYPPAEPGYVGWSALTREAIEEELASGRYDDPAQASFDLTEFAELDDGSRVTVREDRGFGGRASDGDYWRWETRESLTSNVLATLLPEDDDPRPPRQWLIERLIELGIPVEPTSVEEAPYRVEFSARVLELLRR